MNRCRIFTHSPKFRLVSASATAAAGLLMAANPLAAQPMETVVVTAPRVVQQTITTGRSPIGAPVEETTISRPVNFKDLDLSKPKDADTLRARVRDTAKDLCAELDKLYPFEPKDPTCVKKSTDRAMVQTEQVIADASK